MAEDDLLSSLPPLIPFLPDDISARCIARVPVSFHTALSQVSRSWRSFVRSPSFFSLRSELAVTELVLTVSVSRMNSDRSRWYHLHPHRTPSRLPPPQDEQDDLGSASASLGPHIFLLGGISSPRSLQIYDSRRRRWAHGPPMSTPRKFAAAGVAGGRIHVLGSCRYPRPTPSAESLDPTGTRWDPLPSVPSRLFGRWTHRSAVIDGKLIVLSEGIRPQRYGAAFDPATAEWAPAPPWCMWALYTNSLVVVGGVPYVFSNHMERILGYGDDGNWRPVEGEVEKELLCRLCNITLRDFGGLLCLVGEEKEMRDDLIGISCAGINISRTAEGGFRGSIVWLDSGLLKLSLEESLRHCVIVEL